MRKERIDKNSGIRPANRRKKMEVPLIPILTISVVHGEVGEGLMICFHKYDDDPETVYFTDKTTDGIDRITDQVSVNLSGIV